MSSNNIVDLNARRAESPLNDGQARHFGAIRDLVMGRLKETLQTTLTEIDDTLFEMSEKSPLGALKQQFFDDLRALRRTRDAAAERFDKVLRSAFLLFAHGRPILKNSQADQQVGELSLVENDELEVSLALSRIASRCDEGLVQERFELNKRLNFLLQREESDGLTPLSGRVIANSVQTAIAELPIHIESRLILLKAIERSLSEAVHTLVSECNKQLFEAGILPELKLTYSRPRTEPARRSANPGSSQEAPAGEPAAAMAATSSAIDLGPLAAEITRLLQQQRLRPVAPKETNVQVDAVLADQRLRGMADPKALDSQAFASAVRQALTAGRNGETDAAVLTEDVENAIDLVSLMFDFIARDEALPKEFQEALTPLRLPLLRSALRGARVFDGNNHPVRSLMESAAEIGRSWSRDSDKDGKVLARVKAAVAKAVAESETNFEGVERVIEDLRAFIATERKRAQLLERRSAEAARAQERRLAAERMSQQVIAETLERSPVPPVVATLLNGPIRRHLELIHARRGEDSKDWKSACKLVRDIVWSFDPVTISVERAHWQAMLPNIISALRGALISVGMHDEEIDGIIVEFRNRYRELVAASQQTAEKTPTSFEKIDPATMPDAPAPEPESIESVEATSSAEATGQATEQELPARDSSGEEGTTSESISQPSTTQETEAAIEKPHESGPTLTYSQALEQVKSLNIGTWFEIIDDHGVSHRAKLIWNSAVSNRCLFVNRVGQMVADYGYQHVAGKLMRGQIKPIEEGPLFERALSAVKRKLAEVQH